MNVQKIVIASKFFQTFPDSILLSPNKSHYTSFHYSVNRFILRYRKSTPFIKQDNKECQILILKQLFSLQLVVYSLYQKDETKPISQASFLFTI